MSLFLKTSLILSALNVQPVKVLEPRTSFGFIERLSLEDITTQKRVVNWFIELHLDYLEHDYFTESLSLELDQALELFWDSYHKCQEKKEPYAHMLHCLESIDHNEQFEDASFVFDHGFCDKDFFCSDEVEE